MKQYYYGKNKSGPYFEGWYFRCQTREGKSLALIPAMHICEDGQKSASIQVITQEHAWWLDYPACSFSAANDSLCIRIGDNCFMEEGLSLGIEREEFSLRGRIVFGAFQSLKSDIMGPFRWLSSLECVHSVISMRHTLQGQLELNGQRFDFHGGTGYIEADRGRSFPKAYLWTQCMWDGCSLMLSIATVPIGKIHFTGCICSVMFNGQEYRIATYRGATVHIWSSQGVVVCQGKFRLAVQLLEQKTQPLRAPSDGEMIRSVHESLCARVQYRFWKAGELLFDRTDEHAGYECSNIIC